ncbi:hypothetical protein Clacol_002862 [Clathrus columnatus]|uniref:Uncharacterized protein n=1 Tax=Clathrus columnatus TaxID=1419009 RepID=A0AAV5A598_9AGAM|nr:hypothetical protein Clacol_002862 [Clathrus columnatus]
MSITTSNFLSNQGPANARIAAQETQIAELVKRTQDFERTIHDLQRQLDLEKERGIEAVKQIRDKWKVENQQWHDNLEIAQERHRLATLDARLIVENERCFRLKDKELLIQESIARLVKEYNITTLQVKQTELLSQVDALEDQVDAQREELAQILMKHETELSDLKTKLDRAGSHHQEQTEEIKTLIEDKRKYQVEISDLHSSTKASSKQVDRLSLQVESLRTQNTALETRNKELQHQIDKWQTLEGKGEKEMEEHRKRRIEVEVRVKELEVEVEQMGKDARGAHKKISKLEAALLEAQEQIEQTRQEVEQAQTETIEAEKKAAKWEQQVEKLKTALETEKVRTTELQKREKERLKVAKSKGHSSNEDSASEQGRDDDEPGKPSVSRKEDQMKKKNDESRRKVTRKEKKTFQASKDSDKDTKRDDGGVTANSDTIEPEEEDKETNAKIRMKKRGKGKEKEKSAEQQPKKGLKAEESSTAHKNVETDIEDEQPAKKKRRKINMKGVFANPPGFSFSETGDGALDIPSVLSPVKEGQQVPARFGTLGSMLRY